MTCWSILVLRSASISASALVDLALSQAWAATSRRLEGEAAVEVELVVRVLGEMALLQRLGHRRLRIEPRHVGDHEVAVLAHGLEEVLLVEAGRAGIHDRHRLPALLHHLLHQQLGVVEAADRHQHVGLGRLGLATSTERSLAAGS